MLLGEPWDPVEAVERPSGRLVLSRQRRLPVLTEFNEAYGPLPRVLLSHESVAAGRDTHLEMEGEALSVEPQGAWQERTYNPLEPSAAPTLLLGAAKMRPRIDWWVIGSTWTGNRSARNSPGMVSSTWVEGNLLTAGDWNPEGHVAPVACGRRSTCSPAYKAGGRAGEGVRCFCTEAGPGVGCPSSSV